MSDYHGLHRGSITDINDPEHRGRVRMLVPTVLGQAASGWAEPVLPAAEEVNWVVGDRAWMMFEGGDINRPVYLSRMEVKSGDIAPGAIKIEDIAPGIVAPDAPPVTSPTLTVVGLTDSFLLRTETVVQSTHLRYQVSTDETTWTDLPDMPVYNTIVVVKNLPNGDPFLLGVDYFFRVVAGNVVGDAEVSGEVTRQLDSSAVAQVATELIAARIEAGFLLVGEINVGGDNFVLAPPAAVIDPDDPLTHGGLFIRLTNGGLIHLPADGSDATITAHISAQSLDVLDGATINGDSLLTGRIGVGVTIEDPLEAPAVTSAYVSLQTNVSNVRGICRNVTGDGWVVYGGANPNLYEIADDGMVMRVGDVPGYLETAFGVTRVGSNYYRFNGLSTEVFNSDLERVGFLSLNPSPQTRMFGRRTIGTDGTNLLIAFEGATPYDHGVTDWSGDVVLRKYNPSTGNQVGVDIVVPSVGTIGGVYYGPADYGNDRWVLHPTGGNPLVYNAVGVRQSGDEWPRPAGQQVRGMWWDGSNFWVVNNAGLVRRLEELGTGAGIFWSYAFVDGDTHTTGPAPRRLFFATKRSLTRVTATKSPPQVGSPDTHAANRVQILATGSVLPGNLRLQGGPLAVGDLTATFSSVSSSGSEPVNNWDEVFISGAIYSKGLDAGDEPWWSLSGDGNVGHDTGDLAATGSYAGTVRLVRFGKIVYVSGNVTRASGGSDSGWYDTGVLVPEGLRPGADHYFSASPFFGTTDNYRFRVLSVGTLEVQRTADSAQIMSLDALWMI